MTEVKKHSLVITLEGEQARRMMQVLDGEKAVSFQTGDDGKVEIWADK